MKIKKYLDNGEYEYFDSEDIISIKKFIKEAIDEKISKEANKGTQTDFKFWNKLKFFIDNINLKFETNNFVSGTCDIKIYVWCERDKNE